MGFVEPRAFSARDLSTILIRTGEEADAPALLDLLEANLLDGAGQVAEPGELAKSVEEEALWVRTLRENPRSLLLLATHNSCVVGLLDFHIGSRKRLSHLGSFGISILPEWRGKGIGRQLLECLLHWAQADPTIEKVSLAVRADNTAAIALYKKLGFLEEGRRSREIRLADGVYVDDLLMYRWVGAP